MRSRPLMPPVWLLFTLLLMTGLHLLWPLARWCPPPWNLSGCVPLLAGAPLVAWGARLFARAGTTIKPFQESSVLVVAGPYLFTRNPIYVGLVLIAVGVAVLLGTVTPALGPPLFGLVLDRRFIRKEEAMLEQRFGQQFQEYRARVRRWL